MDEHEILEINAPELDAVGAEEIVENEPEAAEATIGNEIEITPEDMPDNTTEDDREELLSRITELERQLSEQSASFERRRAELAEFARLFPDADPEALPDEVSKQISSGVPLAAAYALYERVRQLELDAAIAANKRNTERLNSTVIGNAAEPYFSAEEVKRMSASQVKENFSHIKRSMLHWAKK